MRMTMGLNLLLLSAMVTANIISLYHLTTTLTTTTTTTTTSTTHLPVPDHLIRHLQTIRSTISHLTLLQQKNTPPPSPKSKLAAASALAPPDLLLYSSLSPIASSCHDHPDLLHQYMTYSPFSICPPDSLLSESLILRGCHPLPRRRCFSPTPPNPNSTVLWKSSCRSFSCLDPALGFDFRLETLKFLSYKSQLDLTLPQLFSLAADSPIRLGIDVGGGTGTFAAKMKEWNVTILTTTMDLGAPYSEAAAIRGVVPIHAPLQQRLPVFDGVVDIVRCGRAVNRWIPIPALEFLLYDVDRVLRGGGFLWIDHFFCKGVDLDRVYKPLIGRLGFKTVKWAIGEKSGSKNSGDVYLTALLQKPNSR